ncbi:GMC oxidoreductase [Urechidicola croceus]|uniref:GMC family oxidoreductase n=1 Tax=Urechidicola croceus TaxID=1850246 RepID=A0A1D8PAD5_9FLAO|nr:GMC family oxidoreductase [Urechidicola croceus]AOW21532.1 GMC family oxidoreductase [Urechidicola croceus]
MIENSTSQSNEIYDAIVIGTGISGGWAAKELCEKGLKTLVLERGRMIKHIEDYPTMHMDPWDFKHRDEKSKEVLARKPKQNRSGFVVHPARQHFFVDDIKHPYNEVKRFDWIRGYHVGGRSLMWGRHSYRWSEMDFEANKKDGHGVDWPIRYKDVEPWYTKVEEFIGVCGQNEGISQLPDSNLTPPMELNCVEEKFKEGVNNAFDDRIVTHARIAHITGDKTHEGRSKCQYRNRCMRGCPFGGYFSSNSSTLPAAEKTGNMILRPNSIVHEIIYDDKTKLATGVKVIDANTKETIVYNAKVIFCCASAIASAAILLQSKSKRFPNGLGNDSGELGHNLMDHHFKVGANAEVEGFEDKYYKGRKPAGFYVPRFVNIDEKSEKKDYVRGFGMQGGAGRSGWSRAVSEMSFGAELKEDLLKPGKWGIGMTAFGECLPYHENKMVLDYEKLDEWGLPTVTFDAEWKENELKMQIDMEKQAVKLLKAAGFKNVRGYRGESFPGLGIHEMGTARMGRDPKTSVLNANNQIHTVPNVYVTDGACMTSSACQNPSLTYMALTARAANHAANQLKNNTFKNA